MDSNHPYVGDLSEPTLDYLLWVGMELNPADHHAGFVAAMAKYREGHPERRPEPCPVEAATTPFSRPVRADRPS